MGYVTKFLSTPSARRATCPYKHPGSVCAISIHALREEGDEREVKPYERQYISIHALREEGDLIGVLHAPEPQISIHALREEGDLPLELALTLICDFYPRPPRGGRRI